MIKKLIILLRKNYILILMLAYKATTFSMEEIPGSSSPDHIKDAAKYYVEILNVYPTENHADFKKHFEKYIDAIKEKSPEEQFLTFMCMIQEAADKQNRYLLETVCDELITCYQTHLITDKQKKQYASELVEENILPLELILQSNYFEKIRENFFPHYFSSKKNKGKKQKAHSKALQDVMNQSMLVDETTLFELLAGCLDNWPDAKELLSETLINYSPVTQFNALETCIEIALAQKNFQQANELYENLATIYKDYLAETQQANIYKKKYESLAKEHPELSSKKLDNNDFFPISHTTKVNFDPTRYHITEIKSPRKASNTQTPRKRTIAWQKPTIVSLAGADCAFHIRGSLLFAANNKGEINCYDIKTGEWKKTLRFAGTLPLLFAQHDFTITHKTLTSNAIDDTIHLLSSLSSPAPYCALYTAQKEDVASYILEGNKNGSLVFHNLQNQTQHHFEENHAAPITAILALSNYAYSGSQDRSIKKWNLVDKKCENTLEEMEDTIHKIVMLRGNIISLVGNQKIVHCNLSEKPPTCLPLFQLPSKEKNNALETIAIFHDEYLIAGLKSGQLKIFTFGNGFANIRNIERDVPVNIPVKSLTNFDDEKLLVHYNDDTAMIFSRE